MGEAARRVAGRPRIPVVILTGFLGAGQTTALNALPTEPPEGLTSISYQSRTPVDRRRFYDLLDTWRTRCLRANGQVLLADGPPFVEIVGGRLSSRPLGTAAGSPQARTAFVAILEGLDPREARAAALRDCERARPAPRLPVKQA